MSHRILIEALEFLAGDYSETLRTHSIPTLLTTQRPIFNSLAPVLLSKEWSDQPEFFFRLMMHADTFHFATSLCLTSYLTTALAREVLRKMDFVIHIEIASCDVDDEVTPTLMALPHLERVVFSFQERMTYHGTMRPLLKHPRESVRRSVAASAGHGFLFQLAEANKHIVLRDDIIPLIDSASCNGAVCDYLRLAKMLSECGWGKLSRDIIMMLGERLFQFFTAANSHNELINRSLILLSHLASTQVRMDDDDKEEEVDSDTDDDVLVFYLDVFKEFPVVDYLAQVLRRGALIDGDGNGICALICAIFMSSLRHSPQLLQHHQRRLFELQILDIMYDSYFARSGTSPFHHGACRFCFDRIAETCPLQFLSKTSVLQKELHNFLIPWHREAMSKVLRSLRRGESVVNERGEMDFDKDDLHLRASAAYSILRELLQPLLRRCEPDEMSQVLRLLYDEQEGLNIAPILRSFLLLSYHSLPRSAYSEYSLLHQCEFDKVCSLFVAAEKAMSLERQLCATERRRARRRGRDCAARCYLAEFLDSLDPALVCRVCGHSALQEAT